MLRIIIFCIAGSFLFHQVLAKQKCSPWAVQSNFSAIGPACICRVGFTIEGLFSCKKRTLANGVCLTQGSDNASAVFGYCPYTTKIDGKLDVMNYGNIYFARARTVQPRNLMTWCVDL